MDLHRTIPRLWLCFLLLGPTGAEAQAGVAPEIREWLSALVARVGTAENGRAGVRGSRRPLVVDVRIVVGSDGALRDLSVERSSGSRATDESAVAAVRAAAPFAAPPNGLVTSEGTVDLSFPMEMTRRR